VEEFVAACKKTMSACDEADLLSFLDDKIKVIAKGVARDLATEGMRPSD